MNTCNLKHFKHEKLFQFRDISVQSFDALEQGDGNPIPTKAN